MNENAGCLATPRNDEPCCEAPREIQEQPRQNKMREVRIKQLNHGYFIEIGCQQFAIETSEKLLSALGNYMKDPDGTEKAWFDGKFLKQQNGAGGLRFACT